VLQKVATPVAIFCASINFGVSVMKNALLRDRAHASKRYDAVEEALFALNVLDDHLRAHAIYRRNEFVVDDRLQSVGVSIAYF
jgi:hypothetical protein